MPGETSNILNKLNLPSLVEIDDEHDIITETG